MPPRRPARSKAKTDQTANSAKRATRTGIQSGFSTQLLIQGWNLFSGRPLSFEQAAWVTLAGASVPALVSFLMNAIEDATGHTLLRVKAASDTTPADTLDDDDNLTDRKFELLAAEMAAQRDRSERLENALLDLRKDIGSWRAEPAKPRIFTEQESIGDFRG